MPRARGAALIEACAHVADGRIVLDAGSDRAETAAALQALRGIGPWTAGYVAMRALGDPDVFLPTDLGVRNALVALGADGSPDGARPRSPSAGARGVRTHCTICGQACEGDRRWNDDSSTTTMRHARSAS